MKQKFENTKHNKGTPVRRRNVLSVSHTNDDDNSRKSLIQKGFVAWSERKSLPGNQGTDNEILEGRTYTGGYVAYSK
ncbi:MAG: hypothetical protein ABI472_07165 [Ginsengibacter sp.]